MRYVVRRGFRYGEILLGFDSRVPLGGDVNEWDEARRHCYLVRRDVDRVQSVDTMVWPSLFDYGECPQLASEERERYGLAGLQPPTWTGVNHSLWTDLAELREGLKEARRTGS
jgi:hypothetical protein